MSENDSAIITQLIETNAFIRRPCGICTGETGRDTILCEGVEPDTGRNFVVCSDCLQAGNIDERLRRRAAHFDGMAAQARSIIGRVKVPSNQAYREAQETSALRIPITIKGSRLFGDGQAEGDRPCLLCGTDVNGDLVQCEALVDRGGALMTGAICPGCIKKGESAGLPPYESYVEVVFLEHALWHLDRCNYRHGCGLETLQAAWREQQLQHHDDPVFQAVANQYLGLPEAEVRRLANFIAKVWGWNDRDLTSATTTVA
jgi:hypothetical protein